jgi:hypothetical protein
VVSFIAEKNLPAYAYHRFRYPECRRQIVSCTVASRFPPSSLPHKEISMPIDSSGKPWLHAGSFQGHFTNRANCWCSGRDFRREEDRGHRDDAVGYSRNLDLVRSLPRMVIRLSQPQNWLNPQRKLTGQSYYKHKTPLPSQNE